MDYKAFWHVLRSRPLAALGALYWHATGRKVRARNRLRVGLAQDPGAYQRWIDRIERASDVASSACTVMKSWGHKPIFSVIVHQPDRWRDDAYDQLIESLRVQIYSHWELILLSPNAPPRTDGRIIHFPTPTGERSEWLALREGVMAARGEFVIPVQPDVRIPPTTLFHYAEALQSHPDALILFGDQDRVDSRGQRHDPWFKPQWNQELILAQDYVTKAFALSKAASQEAFDHDLVGTAAPGYSLALAIAWREPAGIRHVPYVQAHVTGEAMAADQQARMSAVRDHLHRQGTHDATVSADHHGIVRVDWPLLNPWPSVSIIIPTRDKVKLLQACVSSLLQKTSYPCFDVIVVDNGSTEASALAYLNEITQDSTVQVIRDDRPYNFSQLNNMAASRATGDYLCLLNNDTEIIEGDWLEAMMRQASRPEVGAVGARLLYDDRTIQHAGVAIGVGDAAGHVHRFQPIDEIGYFARTHGAHFVSAVTAACLVVEKTKFFAVGGLDEQSLAIAFNDVDFCLKLQKAGWANVYTPYATLLHHESKSRGKDTSAKHIARFRQELAVLQNRWRTVEFSDPLRHSHLERSTENFLIRLDHPDTAAKRS
jgi:O-antigen biosynthesis protein